MKTANGTLTINSDLSATRTSDPVYVNQMWAVALQLIFTGTPAGNFKIQFSNDPGDPTAASAAVAATGVVDWTDVPSPTAVTVSAAGGLGINLTDMAYVWIRLVWTATGAGTAPVLTVARYNAKNS